jgi:Xaa-Pro aminopeptidase
MRHGVGLQMTEPPSIHPDDHTVLVPGMALTIEPGLGFRPDGARDDARRCVMVHEENMVVAEGEARLLTRRAPPETPVVGGCQNAA